MIAFNPGEIVEAQTMLNGVGLGIIDTRVITRVLADNPNIYGTAVEWGWDDTEVRDNLSVAVGCYLLGVGKEECVRRIRQSESEFDVAVRQAHDRWTAHNPAQEGDPR